MSYIKEDVECMLREYKKNEAKLSEIEFKIESLEERIRYAGHVEHTSDNETIEAMQLGSKGFDSPSGKTNKISNVTEQVAMSYTKEMVHINKEDRESLDRELLKYQTEKDKYNKKIARVKNLIESLSTEQKFVIKSYYMEKSKWDYVYKEYFMEFEINKTIKRLQEIRDKAIETMLEILNV